MYTNRGKAFLNDSIPIFGPLGFYAMFNYVYEIGQDISETWGTLSSAISAQTAIERMNRADEIAGEEWTEAKKLEFEQIATGKILLACWRGTKLELLSILRFVCFSGCIHSVQSQILRLPWIGRGEVTFVTTFSMVTRASWFKSAERRH